MRRVIIQDREVYLFHQNTKAVSALKQDQEEYFMQYFRKNFTFLISLYFHQYAWNKCEWVPLFSAYF